MANDAGQRGWFSRNWKWALPLGCLGTVVLLVGFVAAILLVVASAVRSSDPYREATSRARAHPAVVETLGEPIEVGWWVSGNISVQGTSGEADLKIPLEGPKGPGMLYVVGHKSAGKWELERMEVELPGGGERLDLLAGASSQR